ncbi:MAG TPA: MaoC family dehydratase N-terminal domain-containing protein [Pseudonocardia sp.]|uniref:FAS1-like dehydratase domain-containing protein n=1 Tax=Pseudonocardia sp. TaxID=60912 RepID=UPI002C316E1A|nr:MaoC family dehydratase N-terminal domain-containing protein [Pseudonocardia sp.]HTF48523.1 MaoC family dehydratase N-terminal domain-containing protein [Pseudonocardia sp.]
MVDESYVGRTLPPSPPYQVGRERIREFATAVGERSPLCHDVEAARAAGYPDLVAPPSFPVVFTMPRIELFLRDPGFGWRFEGTVHGDQKIEFQRPIHAGDELVTVVRVDGLRTRAGTHMLTLHCAVSTIDGEPVCATEALLLSQEDAG